MAALQGGVVDGARIFDFCQFGVAGVGIGAGQSEIEQLRLSQTGNQHVGSFQIAVRNAALEGVIQTAAHIDRTAGLLRPASNLANFQELAQVAPFDELHHDVACLASDSTS